MKRTGTRKRPCVICHKWFLPDTRQINRQKTCGPDCRREYHRRQCGVWNRKNKAYFKANYLSGKLSKNREPPALTTSPAVFPKSRLQLRLPRDVLIERIGGDHLIIVEYIMEQFLHRLSRPASLRPP